MASARRTSLNYLKRAVELRARAATTPDEDMQQFWLRLAEEWEFLAELRENTREVGAPPRAAILRHYRE
jgi:hypothetical protein